MVIAKGFADGPMIARLVSSLQVLHMKDMQLTLKITFTLMNQGAGVATVSLELWP